MFISLTFAFTNSFSQTAPDADSQFWNETYLAFPVLKRETNGTKSEFLNFLIATTNRIGGDGFYPVDERVGFGIEVIVNKHLTLVPSYLFRGVRTDRTTWSYEHQFRFDATIGMSGKHFGVKNRSRLEHEVAVSRRDFNVYRKCTTFRVPIKKTAKRQFDLFASYEPFYHITARRWSIYEFSSGISTKLHDRVSADLFYLRKGNIQASQQPVNAVGLNLRIKLGR